MERIGLYTILLHDTAIMSHRKILFLILLLVTSTWMEARETKIRLSQTVLYVGESEKKIPEGLGTLYVMDKPSKTPVLRQDVITGTFNGNTISSAKVNFSSGWHFEGNLTFSVVTVSKKPLQESFTYDMTGTLIPPDGKGSYYVNNLHLSRLTTEEAEALKSNSMHFKAMRKSVDGNDVEYDVELSVDKDSWKAISKRRLAPAVFFEGEKVSATPAGHGKLSVLASDNMLETTVFDTILGDFSGNEVKNASVTFSSGWQFSGSMNYEIRQTWPEPYALEIEYVLFGKLVSPYVKNHGKNELTLNGDTLLMTVKKGMISLTPYSWEQSVPVSYDKVSKYEKLVQGETVVSSFFFTLEPQEGGKWVITRRMSSEFPEYHFSSGYVITEYDDGFSVQYPTADYLEVKKSRVESIIKAFPDCVVCISEKDSKIMWTNGDVFEGSFKINGIGYGTNIEEYESEIVSVMDPDLFIDEIPLQYLEGIYTYSNGKSERWANGITDYQQNKINGNYERVSAIVNQALREENAAYGAQLEAKWQAVLPDLRQRYGRANVDAIYNYRLNRKTPVELFQELKRLGLIKLSGPIYSPDSKNSVNQYVIYMTNRKTGELQYSLVLKFVHPFWSSPDWILDAYSTSFF